MSQAAAGRLWGVVVFLAFLTVGTPGCGGNPPPGRLIGQIFDSSATEPRPLAGVTLVLGRPGLAAPIPVEAVLDDEALDAREEQRRAAPAAIEAIAPPAGPETESGEWVEFSDAEGRYQMEVPAGTYTLSIYFNDSVRKIANVHVASGSVRILDSTIASGDGWIQDRLHFDAYSAVGSRVDEDLARSGPPPWAGTYELMEGVATLSLSPAGFVIREVGCSQSFRLGYGSVREALDGTLTLRFAYEPGYVQSAEVQAQLQQVGDRRILRLPGEAAPRRARSGHDELPGTGVIEDRLARRLSRRLVIIARGALYSSR